MFPKQKEMDEIVRSIYDAMESNKHLESTLLVLCGDHGMNDAGNHGASSPGETSPALVFISPKLKGVGPKVTAPAQPKDEFDYYSKVEQSDIVPTIAALLGFPVSKNNLGAFISDFLPFWPNASDKIQILVRNARQILNIVTAVFGGDLFDTASQTDPCALEQSDINELACEWRKINQRALALSSVNKVDDEWLSATSSWIRKAQDLMSSMASNFDMSRLVIGQALAAIAIIAAVITTVSSGFSLPLFIISISYGVMMFASSYVEEEQHFWYWTCTLWFVFLAAESIRQYVAPHFTPIRDTLKLTHLRTGRISVTKYHLIALLIIRITRSWNQTGQKFAGEPDIVKLVLARNPTLLWILVTLMYALVWFQMLPNLERIPFIAATSITSVLISSAYSFKLAFTAQDAPELIVGFARKLHDIFDGQSLLWRARVVFLALAALSSLGIYSTLSGGRHAKSAARLFHELTTLFCLTQSRATNVPLFLLAHILFCTLDVPRLSSSEVTLTALLLQYLTFFASGGSNAISSVDLSSAYNGIADFNVIAVGVLTLVSNWAGPIYWTSATNLMLLEKYRGGEKRVFGAHVSRLTLFAAVGVAFVMVACTALRTHLFIWTVFSPKYLYAMAWSIGGHLLINVGFGGLLFWLGAR
jgi:ethanolaminephosphotransferase